MGNRGIKLYHILAFGVAIFAAFRVGSCNKKVELTPIPDSAPFVAEIKKLQTSNKILHDSLFRVNNRPHDTTYKILYRYLNNIQFISDDSAVSLFDHVTGQQPGYNH